MTELTQSTYADQSASNALDAFDTRMHAGINKSEALQATVLEYPELADLLSDYMLQITAVGLEGSVELSESSSEDLNAFDRIANSAALKVREREAMSGIFAQAGKLGLTPASIAEKLRIGLSVLSKLDRRLITVSSIPKSFLDSLAVEIGVHTHAVAQYLSGAPRLATDVNYKSGKPPKASGRQQSFEIAVNASVRSGEMQDSDGKHWLNPTESES